MPEMPTTQEPSSGPAGGQDPSFGRRVRKFNFGGLLTNLLVIVMIVGPVWYLRGDIGRWAVKTEARLYPCTRPVNYEIGHFDERFHISKDDFLAAAADAAAVWEAAEKRDLLQPGPDDIRLDLVYDERQEATDKLESMGIEIDRNESGYQSFQTKYEQVLERYQREKSGYEARLADFERRSTGLAAEIGSWNSRGGAPPGQFERLVAEQSALDAEAADINKTADGLNELVDEVNAMVISLNSLADQLNLGAERYNRVVSARGEKYQEGVYEQAPGVTNITIFEFGSRDDLVRVMAHEFGHALGLEHASGPGALMSAVSQGQAAALTDADRAAIRTLCAAADKGGWRLAALNYLAGWSSAPQRLSGWFMNIIGYEEK